MSAELSGSAARVHGWAVVLAPLLLLASTVAFIYEGGLNDGIVGGTIGVWSTFALAIGLTGIHRLLEPVAPRLSPVFLALSIIAFIGGAAFNVQAMYLAAYQRELLADLSEGGLPDASPLGIFAFLPWGLLTPVVLVGTGLLLWRTRTTPAWSAWLLVLGGVLFVASRPARIDPLALVADLTLVLALVPLGWSILTRRSLPSTHQPQRTTP